MTLPFDSFPIIELGYIKPLAVVPMGILLFFILLAALIGKKKIFLNRYDIIFIFFVLFIIVNSLFQLLVLQNNISATGITPFRRFLEIFYFLPLIAVFYFSPRLAVSDIKDLEKSFKWLLIAFIIPLCWGLLQSIFIVSGLDWVNSGFEKISQFFATRRKILLSNYRVSLFSAEPSWAAFQIIILLIPILISCIHFKFSFFKKINFSFMKLSIESILFLAAVICLIMTFSISGYVSALFLLIIYFLFFSKKKIFYKNIAKILLLIIILITFGYSHFQEITDRFNLTNLTANLNIVSTLLRDGSFAVRYVNWTIGIKEFLTNIPLGVGFRNTLFYYSDLIPDWAARLGEVQMYLTTSNPTPKSFFSGIIGELGLIGLGLFLMLYIGLIRKVKNIKPESDLFNIIKYSLLFSLLSIISLGMSMDFNHPYFWLIFGMASAFISINKTYKNKD